MLCGHPNIGYQTADWLRGGEILNSSTTRQTVRHSHHTNTVYRGAGREMVEGREAVIGNVYRLGRTAFLNTGRKWQYWIGLTDATPWAVRGVTSKR